MSNKTRVLFVCVANTARSQLAEALLRHTDSERFEAFSAGTEPGEVDPRTLDALEHLGGHFRILPAQLISLVELPHPFSRG